MFINILENPKNEKEIIERVREIIKLFKLDTEQQNFPLDGDKTEILAKWIWLIIDLNEGNMTDLEFEDSVGNLMWEIF